MSAPLHLAAGAGAPPGFVSAVLDRPEGPPSRLPVMLTHGAGGDAFGAGLAALALGLAQAGHPVVRFNLPYREAGRATPPKAERSVPAYRAAYADARRQVTGLGPGPWVAGGKSYGGRVASMAAAEGMDVAGLVFYGYPLHAPGREEAPRVHHWPGITVPCLFLEGTEDPFCNLDLLRRHLPELAGPPTLHVVEGGDHSLRVKGSRAPDGRPMTEAAVLAGLAPVVSAWLGALAGQSRSARP
jgi:predicted alpha/beta-hydrolase family hydrolase